jgi:AcrR family transcriptional regulator
MSGNSLGMLAVRRIVGADAGEKTMKSGQPDRRILRSRKALMDAFVDLLLTQGYDAVSVERIAERANVGRSTFYTHYAGKEDILRESLARPSSHLVGMVGGEVVPESLIPLLRHFEEQRKVNRVFFEEPVRALWVRCLADAISPRLAALSRTARARPLLPLPLAARQIAEAQIALIAGCLSGPSSVKLDAMAEALVAVTNATRAALLRIAPSAVP